MFPLASPGTEPRFEGVFESRGVLTVLSVGEKITSLSSISFEEGFKFTELYGNC